jgi:hypothetical protein
MLVASPGWAAKKITVQQLKDLLTSLQQAKKSDEDTAAALRDVDLSEELTTPMMDSFAGMVPGQLTTEQLYILEIRSAILPPPSADIPTAPAPDAAAQKAILDKALDYSTKVYAQLPAVSATKVERRFQDNPQINAGSVGSHSTAVVAGPTSPIRYKGANDYSVTFHSGAEDNPLAKEKTHWGDNGMIALLGQQPVLPTVLQEAEAGGKVTFVRWESVYGHQAAVFSFAVDKKKTHYAVNYCCFPESTDTADQDINMRGGSGTSVGTSASNQPGGNAQGNYMPNANWKPVKTTVPYHGEIFIDPNTGIVVRLITQADFKSSELVRQEDQRIDYAVETVGGKELVLPVRSTIETQELPWGDSIQGRQALRHTLFTSTYKNYQAAGS